MDLARLATTDLTGRFYLQLPNRGGRFAGYYASLDVLRPLLAGAEWQAAVTGYYLNVAGDFDAVRLTYLTTTPERVRTTVEAFAAARGLAHSHPPEPPAPSQIAGSYGGEELRFRRFLATYPLIGLDLLHADPLHARCLFATFRWQVMAARQPYRPHFVRTFERDSPIYRGLPAAEQEQFWADLAHWPNPPQVDWAHMMVNMMLGCDWLGDWRTFFLQPQPPLTLAEINARVAEQGFTIADSWSP
jgi:hypothetical protein